MDQHNREQQAAGISSTPAADRTRRLRSYGIWFLVGLLIGLVPIGIRLVQVQRERDGLSEQLYALQLEHHLASAAVLARHGDYTAARDAASRFFSEARIRLDANAPLTAGQRARLEAALADRDTLITLLARGDQAGAERATAIYITYRGSSSD